ncbi:MAG: pseudoazurin [Pseudomonadota bacterium]
MTTRTPIAAALALLLGAGIATAGEVHEVKMLNADPDNRRDRMVFDPPVLKIDVGDTVRFLATDKGHNAIAQVVPAGAEEFKGKINQEIEVTFDVEGTYLYNCQPHATLGMIGIIMVGDHTGNFEEVADARMRGRASKQRLEDYVQQARDLADTAALQ